MSIFEFINTIVENVMNDLGAFAPVLACFLIIIESIFPILPLSLFIAINAYYMGYIPCFIISYVLTCVGCYISYSFCSNSSGFRPLGNLLMAFKTFSLNLLSFKSLPIR